MCCGTKYRKFQTAISNSTSFSTLSTPLETYPLLNYFLFLSCIKLTFLPPSEYRTLLYQQISQTSQKYRKNRVPTSQIQFRHFIIYLLTPTVRSFCILINKPKTLSHLTKTSNDQITSTIIPTNHVTLTSPCPWYFKIILFRLTSFNSLKDYFKRTRWLDMNGNCFNGSMINRLLIPNLELRLGRLKCNLMCQLDNALGIQYLIILASKQLPLIRS